MLVSTLKNHGIPDVATDALLPPMLRKGLIAQGTMGVEAGVSG